MTLVIEIDPDSPTANFSPAGVLENSATTSGDGENGGMASDISDDPTDAEDFQDPADPGNDPDDPTPLYVPSIGLVKAAGDAVANGDNFDVTFTLVVENNGTVDLNNLSLEDNVAAQFGNAFVAASGLTVQNFVGTGTAPAANAAWNGDNSLDMLDGSGQLDIGDSFEVVFTITIDPDGIDSVSQALDNQANVSGDALDENGMLIDDGNGGTLGATDVSDNGVDPDSENGEDDADGIPGNDPTPIIIADVSAAKQVVGTPVLLGNGNFEATYQVVIENTGTVDLANLSLAEDLATQFGAAYVNASGLTLTTPPADAASNVALDTANFNGGSSTEIVNTVIPSALAVGDSFIFEFTVEIDAAQATGVLNNTVTVGGDAVDENGDPILDSTGAPITATDDSDSGADPSDPNSGAPGDMGTSDDPTPLLIPAIGLAKEAGTPVANGDNFDVTFTLNWENTGTVALDSVEILDDIMTQFGGQFVGATIDSVSTSGTATVVANAAWTGGTGSLITHTGDDLAVGDTIQVVFTVTIDPDASGTSTSGLENQATSTGTGINPDTGAPDPTLMAMDTSDNGADAVGDNGVDENGDGVFANDPTPIIIPDISVVKQVIGTPTKLSNDNFEVTYELVIENTGNVDLANLTLVENLSSQFGTALISAGNIALTTPPSNVSSNIILDSGWDGNASTEMIDQAASTSLAVGDSFVVQFTVEVNPFAAGAPADLSNQVTVGGTAIDPDGNPVAVTDDSDSGADPNGDNPGAPGDMGTSDDPTPLLIPAADLVTVKTLASGDSTPAEGDTVTFEIEVTNSGPDTATGIVLTDLLPAGLTATAGNGVVTQGTYDAATGLWNIGDLASGGTVTLTLEGTVDVGEGGNTITNVTTAARGNEADPSTVGDDLEEEVVVENLADLVTEKTLISGDSTPAEGDSVTFQIAVTNNGAAQATNVSLTDQLPAGITFSGSSVSQGTYNASTGLWTVGTLNDGAIAIITLTGTVDVGEGGNTITNVTTAATGDQIDPSTVGDDLDEAVVVENLADLVTEKTLLSGDPTPAEGDSVTFQISVTNNGAAQATGISLTDQLPAGITFTSSALTQGTYDAATGLWTVGTLNDGGVATIELTGTVDVGEGGNTITNITTAATGDQPDPSTVGDDLEEAVVVENIADLVTEKTLLSGNATPLEGESVTFQIAVTNNGAAQATGVSLVDQLPAGITFTGSSVTQGTYDAATGLWTVGTINESAVAIITLTGTVDVGEGGNTITNITTAATGDQIDPSTVGDDLEESVVVDANADLVTEKTLLSGDATPAEGDSVTFQICGHQ